jgi:hypothetical protein
MPLIAFSIGLVELVEVTERKEELPSDDYIMGLVEGEGASPAALGNTLTTNPERVAAKTRENTKHFRSIWFRHSE